jgi:hypothetical protein
MAFLMSMFGIQVSASSMPFMNIDSDPRPGYYSCPNLSHSARRSELAIAALWI